MKRMREIGRLREQQAAEFETLTPRQKEAMFYRTMNRDRDLTVEDAAAILEKIKETVE